jgi:2-oxoglutarate ferredoxin oxidoreductase subunit beta
MASITKPPVRHPSLPKNSLGLTKRDYEGAMSTLCAGCGHDSVTARSCRRSGSSSSAAPRGEDERHRLLLEDDRVLPAAVARLQRRARSHAALATGANAANRRSRTSAFGRRRFAVDRARQLCHAIRRNLNMMYVLENNGVYGLTKGQFSASADVGSKSKRGEPNVQPPIDPVLLALSLGATFVARSFSGDKTQLVPILKAAVRHNGFALIDVISPCVSFNDHETSTKSYRYTRNHYLEVAPVDFVPLRREIAAGQTEDALTSVTMHDGSVVRFRKVANDYDPRNRDAAYAYLRARQTKGEVVTGLLYLDESAPDMHAVAGTVETPLVDLGFEELCPGSAALAELMAEYR